MVELLTTALATSPGVVSIGVDGQTITYDRKSALEELKFWQRQAARAAGTRPISGQINLGAAW